jgi:3-deoxy-manno-octulosonate cytidylyltransferase (CMP-KDO synthetase)
LPHVTGIIPARYASSRFPGKVLAAATGQPLIRHVWDRASSARLLDELIVATDDRRIVAAVEAFGGRAVMTRDDHPNGSSRLAEVASSLRSDLVVNVQGDEPEIDAGLIDQAVQTLIDRPDCPVATIASPLSPDEDPADPNLVKIVLDLHGRALYFSRALIPHRRPGGAASGAGPLKHVGLYAYRREFLLAYIDLPATPLEKAEQLEQLRILEHGHGIAVAIGHAAHHGIDTPEQYEAFVERWRGRSGACL